MNHEVEVAVRSARAGAFIALLLAGTLLSAAPARGQEAQPIAEPDGEEAPAPTAPVVVDGVDLFHVRGIAGYSADRRAGDITGRIVALGRDPSMDVSTLRAEASTLGLRVTAGDGSLAIVTAFESDARREGLSQQQLAELYVRQIKAAVTSFREQRRPDRLLWSAASAAGATVLLIVLWVGGRWAFRHLDRLIRGQLEAGVERLRIQSFRLLNAEQTWRLLRTLLRGLRVAATLALLFAYLDFTLSQFPWTRGFARGMLDLVVDPVVTLGRSALAAIPGLVFLVVLALVTRLVLRLIRLFFLELARGAVAFEHFDADWAMPTYRLVRVLVIALALVVAYPYIPGSETGAFKGVSLFVGVLFSLGSSSIIGNVIAGYTMTYRRAFRDGDRIRIGDVFGEVTQTRLLVTNVRTPKNEDIVIPNSIILSSSVVNYSAHARTHGLILHTTVGIGYEVPWRQVEAMLQEAARRTAGLLRDPAPFVLQTALGDFAVTYELNVFCDAPHEMMQLYTALHRSILDVFNEYGVQIMTPAYEGDPSEPKVVPPEKWHAPPAGPPAEPPAEPR